MKKFFKTLGWALSWIFVFFALCFNLLSVYSKARKFKKEPKDLFLDERLKPVYKCVCKALYLKRIKVVAEDFEKLPSKQMFMVANHKSSYDPLVLFKAFYESGHMSLVTFVAKYELSKKTPVRKVMQLLKGIFVKRENPRSVYECYLEQVDRIKEGYTIILYPEGTRVKNDNEFGEFKAASFKAPMENYIAISPVAIYGTLDRKPKDADGKHLVYVKALKLVQPSKYMNTKQEYLANEIKNDIFAAFNELKEKAQAAYPKKKK